MNRNEMRKSTLGRDPSKYTLSVLGHVGLKYIYSW